MIWGYDNKPDARFYAESTEVVYGGVEGEPGCDEGGAAN